MTTKHIDYSFNVGSDLPEIDPKNDIFGYAPFAEKLANIIQKNPNPHGLVIALHGEWGSGKSSLLNFTKYYLEKVTENSTIVVEFNPWWFKDSDDLARQFLETFYGSLDFSDNPEKFKGIKDKIQKYGETLSSAVSVLGAIAGAIEPVTAIGSTLLKNIKFEPKSISALKTSLSQALKDQGQRFLFLIDDIDRLSPSEIKDLFKIIKALADFPNVTYLLAFDRKIVSESLGKALGIDGYEYLEKIIQLQLSLPKLNQEKLDDFVLEKIKNIIYAGKKIDTNLPQIKQILWLLRFYIKKPRDAVRIINSIGVLYPALDGEVNPRDFIAIEFIRIFDPSLYEIIKGNKEYFLEPSSQEDELTDLEKKEFHEKWLSSLTINKKRYVLSLIKEIFPEIIRIQNDRKHTASLCQKKGEPRIFCFNYFDVYFQFYFPSGRVGKVIVENIVNLDADKLKNALLSYALKEISIKEDLFDLISEYDFKDSDSVLKILEVVLDIGDDLSKNIQTVHDKIINCIFNLIDRFHTLSMTKTPFSRHHEQSPAQESFCQTILSIINDAIKNSASIILVSNLVAEIKCNNFYGCSGEYKKEIEYKLIERIQKLDINCLLQMDNLSTFIYVTKPLNTNDLFKEKILQIIKNNKLPLFLEKFLYKFSVPLVIEEIISRDKINIQALEGLVDDIDSLSKEIEGLLKRGDITPNQRFAAQLTLHKLTNIAQTGSWF